MSLPKVPSFGQLEKQQHTPTTPLPKRIPYTRPSTFTVVQRILKDLDGRDKSMKIIQYMIKILLYHHSNTTTTTTHQSAHLKQLTSLATQFSITRQVLCLGNASQDVKQLFAVKRDLYKQLLLINSIANAVSDDVYCLHRIGVLPQRAWGRYSEVISAHCWFLSIIVGLSKNFESMCRAEVYGTQQELRLAQMTVCKSVADLLFCGELQHVVVACNDDLIYLQCVMLGCDVFHPSFSKGLQAWSGLISGLLAGYKVYQRVRQ
ncbi:hypothetical protein V8B55DRAFT_1599345 [Mucor lusitanicus]|uniref:Peroxisomal biogenesis factor 11 n=1 Tax=Mucor circinelloides f. lusitanicus TaxID=29924 RepID=A0A8H4BF11_MUCCL|nr:hypothetical protein FB192DRAFT_1284186 [Mucor lusitanicus]